MAYVSEYEDRGLDKVNVRKTITIHVKPKITNPKPKIISKFLVQKMPQKCPKRPQPYTTQQISRIGWLYLHRHLG